jgi:hypothetical protein
MSGYGRITRCLELTDADMDAALGSSGETRDLIKHLVSIARPNDGAPKILLLFARMAAGSCDWLDGGLRVEVSGDERASVIDVMTELGAGMRERLLPTFTLKVPVSEFARSLERFPHMVQPLAVHVEGAGRLVLTTLLEAPPPSVRGDAPASTRPTLPPTFDLGEFARSRTGPAPKVAETPTMRPPTLDPRTGMGVYQAQPGLLPEDALVERMGSLDRVPRIVADADEVRALSQDRATAFLLSQIDGVSTLDMIVDVSGMPRLDALRILFALLERHTLKVD